MKSAMQHSFAKVPSVNIERSSFDRSHGHKTTFDGGWLIPVLVDECLPGDTFNVRMNAFVRLATPLKPVMDNMYLESFFFAVPLRLLWDNWEKFNGAQDNPGDSTSFLVPQTPAPAGPGGVVNGSLGDYMGLPTEINTYTFNALHMRAYNLIYNAWFKDENLQNNVVVDTDNGPDTYADYSLLRRGKRHDYFTSCLPWPQKLATPVSIPLGTRANVLGIGAQDGVYTAGSNAARESSGATPTYTTSKTIDDGTTGQRFFVEEGGGSRGGTADFPNIYADLSTATAATINALREAFQLQKLYERDARGGTRYTEIVKAHFGVVSPDARLQRPEYLGGGSTMVNIHPVAQTSTAAGAAAEDQQGNLAGFGTASISGHGFTKSFTEHCVIIGLVSVRADLTYQQGKRRMWDRQTRFDFYWPALAHIGEQAVLNKEIWADGSANDELVFGYQERFAEYRYFPSLITGQFRSNYTASLDVWHLSQDFAGLPVLNAAFIVDNPPIDRIIAVPAEPHFIFDSVFSIKCARPMPVFSVPGKIDHF